MSAWCTCLLVVLSVTAGDCGAAEWQRSQTVSLRNYFELTHRFERLLSLVHDLDSRLESRMDALNRTLESRIDALNRTLESRMDTLGKTLESRMDTLGKTLGSRMDTLDSTLKSRVDALDKRLGHSQMDALNTTLESRMDALNTTLESRIDSLNSRLESQMDALGGRLTVLDSRLDGAVNKTEIQIAGLTVKLDQVQTRPGPRDCSDLPAGAKTGVHALWPFVGRPVPAFCDMQTDGGNWTVFQRRDDVQPRQDFFLGWEAYKKGFGNLTGEFWWGLESLWTMTSVHDRQYELRIDLEDFQGSKTYTVFQGFRISSEGDGYRLNASNYTGYAASYLQYSGINHKFSTHDRDNDDWSRSCAELRKGAWWYGPNCAYINLNGQYLESCPHDEHLGIRWLGWTRECLKKTEMKFRPI